MDLPVETNIESSFAAHPSSGAMRTMMLVTYFRNRPQATDHDVTVVSGRFEPRFPIYSKPGADSGLCNSQFYHRARPCLSPRQLLCAGVETHPQVLVLAVTHWVPLSEWHEIAENPVFLGLARIACQCRELVWEIRVKISFDTSGLLSVRY